jgi:benzoyl-CoA reductase/2-hydroxyglutaryl-CoA dehydratase subunit BcrC/BadD/HgdB
MARNKISDLRDFLFIALEELNDEGLTEEQFERAIKKAQAVAQIGKVIVDTAKEENNFIKLQNRGEEKLENGFFNQKQLK